MIVYLYSEWKDGQPLKVKLDGKVIGEIRRVEGGFQYFAKGQKSGGEVMKTITAVQKSLE